MTAGEDKILDVRDLKVWFPVRRGVFARTVGHVKAVDGVTFDLRRGETLGVVGESGSGKSTVARAITGLVKPTAGSFVLTDRVQMVFQDPLGSLNPRETVRDAVGRVPRGFARPDPAALLAEVGLDASALDKYPHEFSGGQRQRICLARALATKPELLVCDEAVSALDLSIRAQILDLLAELKRRHGLSLLFITHDIGVVNRIADRIIVMNKGRIVESGTCAEVIGSPRETYTKTLLAAVPRIGRPLAAAAALLASACLAPTPLAAAPKAAASKPATVAAAAPVTASRTVRRPKLTGAMAWLAQKPGAATVKKAEPENFAERLFANFAEDEIRTAAGFFGPVTKKWIPTVDRFNEEYFASADKMSVVARYVPMAEAALADARAMKVSPAYEAQKAGYIRKAAAFVKTLRMAVSLRNRWNNL